VFAEYEFFAGGGFSEQGPAGIRLRATASGPALCSVLIGADDGVMNEFSSVAVHHSPLLRPPNNVNHRNHAQQLFRNALGAKHYTEPGSAFDSD
jgi:hypothetical protein